MSELITKTVSDLQNENQLFFRRGWYNIIDCGVRTGKTYWAVNNLQQFTRDSQLNRILFLTDTTALKDQIIEEYDNCIDANMIWENPSSWGENINKIGIMCYQALGQRFVKEDIEFLNNIDVICWDECDSIFNFAVQAFNKSRSTDFAKQSMSNAEVLSVIQRYSTKKEYMPLVLLGEWEKIIIDGRIMCIGLSATPERAKRFYESLVSASNQGKLEMGYRIAADIYFSDLAEHVRQLQPAPGRGYWCYSPYIEPNKGIVTIAKEQGFNAIELHSPQNRDKPMTEEQMRVYNSIVATGKVPFEYDFIVVNKALERGISIIDRRFDNVIIDSYDETERIQAARQTFTYQRHLKMFAPRIPDAYLNTWLPVDKCRELAEYMNVPELDKANKNTSHIMTWNRLKTCLPMIGYQVEDKRKRISGKLQQCYYITGEWHDAVIDDNNFLKLVEAKLGDDKGEE